MQGQPTCECGCGAVLKVARYPSQQARFIHGHGRRKTGHEYEVRDCGHSTPCWVWTRARTPRGYGSLGGRGHAHTVVYERHRGPVPNGLELDHLCRNHACVNPDHLEPVTHAENMRRGASTKLDWDKVREIRASSETLTELARRFGVSLSCIYLVRKGSNWRE